MDTDLFEVCSSGVVAVAVPAVAVPPVQTLWEIDIFFKDFGKSLIFLQNLSV